MMTSRKSELRPESVRRAGSPAERILAAADKLFYLHGIRAVGVDAVAEEAGVSKRTLYNHYPTKDDLIAAYLVGRFKHIAPSDAPAREQILGYFERLEREFSRPDFRGCPYHHRFDQPRLRRSDGGQQRLTIHRVHHGRFHGR